MIWQAKCKRILMLTEVMEQGKKKCEQYWPTKMGEELKHPSGGVGRGLDSYCREHTVAGMAGSWRAEDFFEPAHAQQITRIPGWCTVPRVELARSLLLQ
ncbi:unnamed protein product [Bursaphelenchus okinawaensis]|uniref:Tyrosine-protein phosphatase domain-containing protein n=1 Tax=Bursaphelenchus okinawaensis TaxID=465554 RepID=A0A811KAK5_9BILA|nr:unnamed protein product [Bursaphelenchus okinawaensis]CAG9097575.1 unnamed protein product [Bursaphelenchus okinawaensis]